MLCCKLNIVRTVVKGTGCCCLDLHQHLEDAPEWCLLDSELPESLVEFQSIENQLAANLLAADLLVADLLCFAAMLYLHTIQQGSAAIANILWSLKTLKCFRPHYPFYF